MDAMAKHSVSVAGIVVRDDDRILAIKRADNGHWEPPGGVLELNETFEAGVQREVWEETGVVVTVEGLSGVYKNLVRGVVALVYRCRLSSGEPRPTEEARETAWMTMEEVKAAMTPAFAIRVLDAFEPAPRSRAHDGITVESASG